MKILYFDDFKLGVLRGDDVIDVSAAVSDIPLTGPHDLISGLIARFDDYRGALEKLAEDGEGVTRRLEDDEEVADATDLHHTPTTRRQ